MDDGTSINEKKMTRKISKLKIASDKTVRLSGQVDCYGGSNPNVWKSSAIQNDIIKIVAEASKDNTLESKWPETFARYRTMRHRDGEKAAILRILETNEVELVSQDDFNFEMTAYYRRLFDQRYLGQAMDVSAQHRTTSILMQYLPKFSADQVKIFAFPDEPFYCWKKLSFTLIPKHRLEGAYGECQLDDLTVNREEYKTFDWVKEVLADQSEAWTEIIARMKNAEAVMAWFGSLFERESGNQQFVYLHGEGGDSKGTIVRVLQTVFGKKLYHSQNLPDRGSGAKRFFQAPLEGKLLLICPDTAGGDIFSDTMKSVTGGDDLVIERKGKDARNASNHVRVLEISNDRPRIPNIEWARRRIIYGKLEKVTGESKPRFEETLLKDAKVFFSLCKYVWDYQVDKMHIKQDKRVYDENSAIINDDLLSLVDKYFEFTDVSTLYSADYKAKKNEFPHITVADFHDVVKTYFKGHSVAQIRALINDFYPVSTKPELLSKGRYGAVRVIYGAELRTPTVGLEHDSQSPYRR